MATDLRRILRSVIDDVFGRDITVEYTTDKRTYGSPHYRARIVFTNAGPTDVELSVISTRVRAWISELDVGYVETAEDADGSREASLRKGALILRAYVRGEGLIEHQEPFLSGYRPRPLFIARVEGTEYRLGLSNVSQQSQSARQLHPWET